MIRTVCVYCSSSEAVAKTMFTAADELGATLARSGYGLIYGGGSKGLMGALARGAHRCGGRVTGVIPEAMRHWEVAYEAADELVWTRDMRERKTVMELRADAFVALPGGFGTLDELLEILTLKLLRQHNKPVILVNVDGFYDRLIRMFEQLYAMQFARDSSRHEYYVVESPSAIPTYLANYRYYDALARGQQASRR